ncbi:MAG: peptidoglycan-binding domain-containing protein [Myxococcota bacterium]
MALLKRGSNGGEVKEFQQKLGQLGFDVDADGAFGDQTLIAVVQLQTLFGYTVDGLVGDGTKGLVDAQVGYGWNIKDGDALAKALKAQGKLDADGKLK